MIVQMAIDDAAGDRTSGAVITTRDGRAMDRSSATGLVNTIARNAKLEKIPNPHLIRSSGITGGLEDWMDIRDALER